MLWGCGRMKATSGTTVVEVYLYNRNIKAYDLKIIIYIFGQLLKYMEFLPGKTWNKIDVLQLKAVPTHCFK